MSSILQKTYHHAFLASDAGVPFRIIQNKQSISENSIASQGLNSTVNIKAELPFSKTEKFHFKLQFYPCLGQKRNLSKAQVPCIHKKFFQSLLFITAERFHLIFTVFQGTMQKEFRYAVRGRGKKKNSRIKLLFLSGRSFLWWGNGRRGPPMTANFYFSTLSKISYSHFSYSLFSETLTRKIMSSTEWFRHS